MLILRFSCCGDLLAVETGDLDLGDFETAELRGESNEITSAMLTGPEFASTLSCHTLHCQRPLALIPASKANGTHTQQT